MTLSEAEEYYHNKGQEDYPHYDPPTKGILLELLGPSYTDYELACIAAYKAGYHNAKEMAGD